MRYFLTYKCLKIYTSHFMMKIIYQEYKHKNQQNDPDQLLKAYTTKSKPLYNFIYL